MVSKVALILLCSVALAIGVMLNVVAISVGFPGTGANSWFNCFTILFYLLSPLPVLACGKGGHNDPFDEGSTTMSDVAFFLTGILVTCGFALPALLTRGGVMAWQSAVMSAAGGVIVYAAVIMFIKSQFAGHDHEMSAW